MGDATDGRTFRSIRGRFPIQGTGPQRGDSSTRLPGCAIARGSGDRSVYSKGVCRLDEYGHRLYNIEDVAEVYISRQSPRAMSDEEDTLLIRATDGNFVGQPGGPSDPPIDAERNPEDPENLFGNVPRGSSGTDIRGVVGTVRNGKVVPEPEGSRMMGRVVRPSLRSRGTDDVLPDVPERLHIGGRDATKASGTVFQQTQRTSTGFRTSRDDQFPDGLQSGDDGPRRYRNGRSDPRVEASSREGGDGRGTGTPPDKGGHPPDHHRRGPQVLGDPPSLRKERQRTRRQAETDIDVS